MARKTIRCTLVTPEARVLDAEVEYARVPLHDGAAGFQHDTGALVAKLGPGELRLDMPGGTSRRWFIGGGFLQNVEDNLTILAEQAIGQEDLDEAEIKAELAEAEARNTSDFEEMTKITEERHKARAKLAVARAR
ncbi:MAG: F0F1 ATP synthase subunit epsilon [Planctomycetota bacterium]